MRGAITVVLSMVLAAAPLYAGAQTGTQPAAPKPGAAAPPPPPPPAAKPAAPEKAAPDADADTSLEPEITITTKGETRYEEHRVNGRLYKIKVIPKNGPPYYLIDHDGKGQFRRSELQSDIAVPTWVIKRF